MTVPEIPWSFAKAYLVRVVDGDTIDLTVDVGFRHTTQQRFRLIGLNAPECRGETREWGQQATRWVEEWCAQFDRLLIDTYKADAFGRWLARVYNEAGRCLNDEMIRSGYAVAWDGRGRCPTPWDDGKYPRI